MDDLKFDNLETPNTFKVRQLSIIVSLVSDDRRVLAMYLYSAVLYINTEAPRPHYELPCDSMV